MPSLRRYRAGAGALTPGSRLRPLPVEGADDVALSGLALVALEIERHAADEVGPCPDAVDGLLHLAVTTIASLDGV